MSSNTYDQVHEQGVALGLRREGSKCGTCWGYGLWAIGDPAPMGPMDANDAMPAQPCPECGACGTKEGDK